VRSYRKWPGVGPLPLTSNGTSDGIITISSTIGVFVGQLATVKSSTQPEKSVQVKRILSATQIQVGPRDESSNFSSVSWYLTADSAVFYAPEQDIPSNAETGEIWAMVYEHLPIAALRSIMVDPLGQYYTADNPLPTSATFSGELSVALTDIGVGFDSVRVGDGSGNYIAVNPDGSINAVTSITFPTGLATEAKQDVGNTSLVSIDAKLDTTNTLLGSIDTATAASEVLLTSIDGKLTSPLSVVGPLTDAELRASPVAISALSLPLPTGAATEAKQDVGNASLASIDAKLTNPLPVSGPLTDAELRASPVAVTATLADEPIIISGTEDGNPSGTEFAFVNNRRLQILAAKDREQYITYADFGTTNQRVTQIDYISPSIGVGAGYTARKNLSYTLVGTRYRRDTITWSLV